LRFALTLRQTLRNDSFNKFRILMETNQQEYSFAKIIKNYLSGNLIVGKNSFWDSDRVQEWNMGSNRKIAKLNFKFSQGVNKLTETMTLIILTRVHHRILSPLLIHIEFF